MERLTDREIGKMWAQHYPQRTTKESGLLLKALVNIIKGNSLIITSKTGGEFSTILLTSFIQCNVSKDQYSQIDEINHSINLREI